MDRLMNKVALVSGGASGLGAATAARFIEEGARVLIYDLNADAATHTSEALGPNCAFAVGDHCNRADNEAAVRQVVALWGGLDILFSNAGLGYAGPFEDVTDEDYERVMDANLTGHVRLTQAAIPALRHRAQSRPYGTCILYTGSAEALRAWPRVAPYTISKHGITGLTRLLALELAPDNIRVNSVNPGATDTPLLRACLGQLGDLAPDEAIDVFRQGTPLRRLCEPEDVANAALFLCSDEARMITSCLLPVCGGATFDTTVRIARPAGQDGNRSEPVA